MKRLIKDTLNLDIDNIPKAGRTITKDEKQKILDFIESILEPQTKTLRVENLVPFKER